MKQIVLVLLLSGSLCTGIFANEPQHLYSTGKIMEVDRVASAWLIKRHVDPEASFIFFEDGQLVTKGTAFDTPDARFSRTHNQSTFEVLMRHFRIDDPKVIALAKAVHQIEINYWAGADNAPVSDLARRIKNIIKENPDPAQCLAKSFVLLDRNFGPAPN